MHLSKKIIPLLDSILVSEPYEFHRKKEIEVNFFDIEKDFRQFTNIKEELFKKRSGVKELFDILYQQIQQTTQSFSLSDDPARYLPPLFMFAFSHLKKCKEQFPDIPVTTTIFNNNVCFYLYYELFDGFKIASEKYNQSYDYLLRCSTLDIPYVEWMIDLAKDVRSLK